VPPYMTLFLPASYTSTGPLTHPSSSHARNTIRTPLLRQAFNALHEEESAQELATLRDSAGCHAFQPDPSWDFLEPAQPPEFDHTRPADLWPGGYQRFPGTPM